MSAEYATLAPFYDRIGLSDFSAKITPHVYLFAQASLDWVGRTALDLGCGTGVSARFLADRGLTTTAVDSSPEMLSQAQRQTDTGGLGLSWHLGDFRNLDARFGVDLILALEVVNDLISLSDIESLFETARRSLDPGKLFVFDVITVKGLAQREGDQLMCDSPSLSVFSQRRYDYERQLLTSNFTLFANEAALENGTTTTFTHTRHLATATYRAYPIYTITALLQRAGLTIAALVTPQFEAHDIYRLTDLNGQADRVLFFASRSE
jgi:ubiquinone/menaquinone biosynthesis C-methylase UbiE